MNSVQLRIVFGACVIALGMASAWAQTGAAAAAAPASAAPAAAAAASTVTGKRAWFGKKFTGRKTASGEAFNPSALTMAHKTLPFGTLVKVTNPKTARWSRSPTRRTARASRCASTTAAPRRPTGSATCPTPPRAGSTWSSPV